MIHSVTICEFGALLWNNQFVWFYLEINTCFGVREMWYIWNCILSVANLTCRLLITPDFKLLSERILVGFFFFWHFCLWKSSVSKFCSAHTCLLKLLTYSFCWISDPCNSAQAVRSFLLRAVGPRHLSHTPGSASQICPLCVLYASACSLTSSGPLLAWPLAERTGSNFWGSMCLFPLALSSIFWLHVFLHTGSPIFQHQWAIQQFLSILMPTRGVNTDPTG